MVTPPQFRGRIAAAFLMTYNLMGMCLGPMLVAFVTDFILKDPAKIRESRAITYMGVSIAAILVFALGLPPAREALRADD
jgi:hypothetical protein